MSQTKNPGNSGVFICYLLYEAAALTAELRRQLCSGASPGAGSFGSDGAGRVGQAFPPVFSPNFRANVRQQQDGCGGAAEVVAEDADGHLVTDCALYSVPLRMCGAGRFRGRCHKAGRW